MDLLDAVLDSNFLSMRLGKVQQITPDIMDDYQQLQDFAGKHSVLRG